MMKEISQMIFFKSTRWWCQKEILFLIFCFAFLACVVGFLCHIKSVLDEDLQLLRTEKEAFQIKIQKLTQDRKNYFMNRRLYEKVRLEGLDQPSMKPSQVYRLITSLSKRYHFSEVHSKRGAVDQEGPLFRQAYTIFLSAFLDVDVFDFIQALSQETKGLVGITLISLFREDDGILKGEIRFNLLTSSKGEGPIS